MKKISFVLFLLTIIAYPKFIFAMKINEIMYDVSGTDTGREWVELYNDSDFEVDLSKWKFFESNVGHTLKLIKGTAKIAPKSFVVLADNDQNFLIDNPNFLGTLFDSAFSLTNTGETLILLDENGNKTNEISYSDALGAKGDGNSLQLIDGFLLPAPATPGLENKYIPESSLSNETSTSTESIDISSHSSQVPISKMEEKTDFEVSVGRERVVSIKTPVIFKPEVDSKFRFQNIKYLWNFGDGNQEKGKKIEHIFKHPGTYNIVLNANMLNKHAVARSVVKVFSPNIKKDVLDVGVKIYNESPSEINIGGWKIKSENESIKFTFPQDTIISAKTGIIFDRDLFIKKDEIVDLTQSKLDLYFPNGDLVQ